jgi:hypothetical protein
MLSTTLHTLRITIDYRFFCEPFEDADEGIVYPGSFSKSLATTTSLENLTITLQPDGFTFSDEPYYTDREDMAHMLFDALTDMVQLSHVALLGDWALSPTRFLNFIKHHVTSLRCLIIYGCLINGHRSHVLPELAELSRSKLEYLSMRFASSTSDGAEIVKDDIALYEPSDAPHFDCVTGFWAGFCVEGIGRQ